jgi:hypothetical protein
MHSQIRRLTSLVVLAVIVPFAVMTDSEAQVTPVNGSPLGNGDEIIVEYQGEQILVEPEKGPVQGIVVEKVDNLKGSTVEGIVIIETRDGWVVSDENFLTDAEGAWANTRVAQGYHVILEPTE